VRPTCIITDLVMPELDGLELVRQLRQQQQFANTVIIVSSASVFEADQIKSMAAGSNAFLPKPVNSETLFSLLTEFLQVQWRFQPAEAEPAEALDLVLPPLEIFERIRAAAFSGDMAVIKGLLIELEELPVQYQPFAIRLKKLANEFRLNELSAWLAAVAGEKARS
jgi:CheY-like chemotaxis protein